LRHMGRGGGREDEIPREGLARVKKKKEEGTGMGKHKGPFSKGPLSFNKTKG